MQVQARCRSMCRCGLTGRGRTGAGQGQGPSRVARLPRVSLPTAARNVQSIGRTPLVQTYFGCCSNCHSYGFSFLALFSPSVFFSSLSIVAAPSGCGVGEKRPWVVQDEIDKGKRIMEPCKNDGMPPRPKLPYCRSVPWPNASMGKGRARGTGGWGQDNLIAHPPASTVHHSTAKEVPIRRLAGGLSSPSWVLLGPGRTPRSIVQSAFSHSSEHLGIYLCLVLSLIFSNSHSRSHSLAPGRPINP